MSQKVRSNKPLNVNEAPDHIKLAIDLIQLLETSGLDSATIIKALEITLEDFHRNSRPDN